jgi:hypothetical protein
MPMDEINIKDAIEADIKRFSLMLEKFKSGRAKTGDMDNEGRITDNTASQIAYVESILRDLRALLATMK